MVEDLGKIKVNGNTNCCFIDARFRCTVAGRLFCSRCYANSPGEHDARCIEAIPRRRVPTIPHITAAIFDRYFSLTAIPRISNY